MIEWIPSAVALLAVGGLSGRAVLAGWRRLQEARQARRRVDVARQALLGRIDLAAHEHARGQDAAQRSWQGWRRFVVVRKVAESQDVRSFYLRALDGRPLATFKPGQYLTLRLHVPGQPRAVTRCYSLSDAPRPDTYRITVKRIAITPRGQAGVASSFLHDEVDVGNVVEARSPAGAFWLEPTDPTPVVLVAGGIGVTPVLAMLQAIVEAGPPRPVWFFHGVRNSADHAMADPLAAVAARHPQVRLLVCYSQPSPGEILDDRFQHQGRVDVALIRQVVGDLTVPHFYLCGPPAMMKSLVEGLHVEGVPSGHVHHEAFGPASVKQAARSARLEGAGACHEVAFIRSGRRIPWDGASTLLELAEREGLALESGCRAGNCGSCATPLFRGEVVYPTVPGAPVPAGACLACVARPASDLELDA
jgi:ferredoxin-NADP reductase